MNGTNPQEWLMDILERIPTQKVNNLYELLQVIGLHLKSYNRNICEIQKMTLSDVYKKCVIFKINASRIGLF